MRVQAGNLGGETVFKGGGGPESFVGGEVHGTGIGVSADPASVRASGFWGGLRFLDGGAAVRVGDPTYGEASFRADWLSGEVGFRGVNKDSASDRGMRVGLSVGAPNAGLRRYAQDLDRDGKTERGTGVTIPVGPYGVSLDMVSETRMGDMGVEVGDLMANCFGLPPMATIANEVMMASGGADQSLSAQLNPMICDALGMPE